MRIRFPLQGTVNANSCIALDFEEIVAYEIVTYNSDQHSDLHLWFKGQSDSVIIQEKLIGKDYFRGLLVLLESQF
jgi:hypothetical protein